MLDEIKFKSASELYKRLLPALKSKVKELHKAKLHYIHEEDLWNYLKNYKWIYSQNLDLGEMVNDIFHVDVKALDEYVVSEIKRYHRDIDKEAL